MKLTVSEIMAATQARGDVRAFLSPEEAPVTTVTADSRKAGPGALFCCLPGSRVDGHDFAAQAVAQGTRAVLAHRELPEISDRAAVLVVPDVLAAMGLLARFWRRRTRAVVAALSGSAGKSTAKEFLAAIAARLAPSIKNPGNFNNQLGLPLSMLAASEEHRLWVLELGISRPGDMEELAAVCEPDLAVVHNIGPAHLEGLGDLAGVARAKAALFGFVREGGAAVANIDYPELWEAALAANPEVLPMSTRRSDVPFYCRYLGCGENGRGRYHLVLQGEAMDVELACRGEHLAENVLAAAAAANILNATPDQIAAGLAEASPLPRRFDVTGEGGFTVIDDTYNANPLSMQAAIEAARKLAAGTGTAAGESGEQPLVLVLGEMGELGPEAGRAHEELGECIARGGCRVVFFKGDQASQVARGLESGGYAGEFHPVQSPEDFAGRMEAMGLSEATVLFKGSRSQRMEDFVERFRDRLRAKAGTGKKEEGQ
jgi:UDP-N-acetylmuramoyl-tripeptide--D-alanyl-D-alanine ligase